MKTNYREKHAFEDDNQPPDFRGLDLCVCGLPKDSHYHVTPKQTTGEDFDLKLRKEFDEWLVKYHIHEFELTTFEWDCVQAFIQIKCEHLLDELEEGINKKESHINYHIENGIEYLNQNDVGISIQWERGYNKALSDILTLVSKMRGK